MARATNNPTLCYSDRVAHSVKFGPVHDERSACPAFPEYGDVGAIAGEVGEQADAAVVVLEIVAISDIEVGLGRQALRQQHCVTRQFYVVVGDLVHCDLPDAAAIDQILYRDEYAVHEYCVVR